jgi:hypothetical protein
VNEPNVSVVPKYMKQVIPSDGVPEPVITMLLPSVAVPVKQKNATSDFNFKLIPEVAPVIAVILFG